MHILIVSEKLLQSFNLNLLECKLRYGIIVLDQKISFNLNLLECKLLSAYLSEGERERFNLNLLECK